MELVLQHQKLNKMETYKVFIDYVEGSGEVEWNCPHILLPHPVVTSCTCYRDAYDGWGAKAKMWVYNNSDMLSKIK